MEKGSRPHAQPTRSHTESMAKQSVAQLMTRVRENGDRTDDANAEKGQDNGAMRTEMVREAITEKGR